MFSIIFMFIFIHQRQFLFIFTSSEMCIPGYFLGGSTLLFTSSFLRTCLTGRQKLKWKEREKFGSVLLVSMIPLYRIILSVYLLLHLYLFYREATDSVSLFGICFDMIV